MNTILLHPTDVLFFRDGRPMDGSLAGHTAAWPLPDVTNHALHAALHRADLEARTGQKLHLHRRGRSGIYSVEEKHCDKKFGSLVTAGPFPVRVALPRDTSAPSAKFPNADHKQGTWFFPRPKDAQMGNSTGITHRPSRSLKKVESINQRSISSLPHPLRYAVVNTQPPSKEAGGQPWISQAAFNAYLKGQEFKDEKSGAHFLRDDQIADREHRIGIGIAAETQTQDKESIYSAHYLRLRDEFRLGLFAKAMDGLNGNSGQGQRRDLIEVLFNGGSGQIVVGGQQRICTASRVCGNGSIPLPKGLNSGFTMIQLEGQNRWLVKWILLTPSIWPEILKGTTTRGTRVHFHPGGWIPNWIDQETGDVLLHVVNEAERLRRRKLSYHGHGYATDENAKRIGAKLVAALVPKPIPVTGWAVPVPNDTDRAEGGAKPTHLAVPAGAVYYFEANTNDDAVALANSLNWHGASDGTQIKNRRSTLFGEKGFGLGVCGTWDLFENVR